VWLVVRGKTGICTDWFTGPLVQYSCTQAIDQSQRWATIPAPGYNRGAGLQSRRRATIAAPGYNRGAGLQSRRRATITKPGYNH